MFDKVTCLKRILSKLTGKNADEYEYDTVCGCLHEIASVVPTLGDEVTGMTMNFARKTTADGEILLGYDGNVSAFLTCKNGKAIPVTVKFTDME